jgi:ADP-ribose pyrophosphatase YjhB (NUDIX family)
MGIICFRNKGNKIEYLCICRKDSLGYIDFIRGKYSLYDKEYIQNLINEMTESEKKRLLTEDFATLWKSLWGSFASLQYRSEERQASDKFKQLKRGIIINKLMNNSYNLESLINDCSYSWDTPEWGFPKGKRNYQETDFKCAIREFYEETGYSNDDINILINVVPYEEIFIGSNLKTYKHKYYIAKFRGDETTGNFQKSEISDMKWFTFEECKSLFRPYNKEKISMLQKLNTTLSNYKLI